MHEPSNDDNLNSLGKMLGLEKLSKEFSKLPADAGTEKKINFVEYVEEIANVVDTAYSSTQLSIDFDLNSQETKAHEFAKVLFYYLKREKMLPVFMQTKKEFYKTCFITGLDIIATNAIIVRDGMQAAMDNQSEIVARLRTDPEKARLNLEKVLSGESDGFDV